MIGYRTNNFYRLDSFGGNANCEATSNFGTMPCKSPPPVRETQTTDDKAAQSYLRTSGLVVQKAISNDPFEGIVCP